MRILACLRLHNVNRRSVNGFLLRYSRSSLYSIVLNGDLMSNRWILQAIVVFVILTRKVMTSGVFELSLLKLNNNRGVTYNGRCCKGPSSYPPCTGECDTFVTVCLMHYVQSLPPTRLCQYGSYNTSLIGGNNILLEEKNKEGTILIPIDFGWPGRFTAIVESWHTVNGDLKVLDSSQLIIQSFISTTLVPSNVWSIDTTITPTTEQQVRYRLVCDVHYFGTGCDVYCRPRDDQFGHFKCSENGTKICDHGWTGTFCDRPFCSEECLRNRGKCDRPFQCRCRLGWTGENCGECQPSRGCLHGHCHRPYQCICKNGWTGLLCDIYTKYCQTREPCFHGGTCVADHVTNYTCLCPPGFGGDNCRNPLCYDDYCQNGGTCETRDGVRECKCLKKFYGERCEEEILSCEEIHCLNGGKCLVGQYGGYCVCTDKYTGSFCETKIKPCLSQPCQNDAECRNTDSSSIGYTCFCQPGFGGINCSIRIDPCAATFCHNGGKCKFDRKKKTPVCACADGYSGEFCEVTSDPCAGVKCLNSGKCKTSLTGNGFLCQCAKGYHGEMCEMEMNPCESSPCQNGGTCKSYISTFICICRTKYSGKLCESEKHITGSTTSTLNDGVFNETEADTDYAPGNVQIGKTQVSISNSNYCVQLYTIFLCVVMVCLMY
ncbi:Delta-like protein 4 [Mactra antiquata]